MCVSGGGVGKLLLFIPHLHSAGGMESMREEGQSSEGG